MAVTSILTALVILPVHRPALEDSLQSGPPQTMPHRTRTATQVLRNVLLRQSRLMQCNQLSSIRLAEPQVPYPLTGLSDQPQHAALGNAVPLTKLCRGSPGNVLSYQTIDGSGR